MDDTKSTANLKAFLLDDQETFENLVPLNDAAFLFVVYVTLHFQLPQQQGWYSTDKTWAQVANVKQWMAKQQETAREVTKGNAALRTHLNDLWEAVKKNQTHLEPEQKKREYDSDN